MHRKLIALAAAALLSSTVVLAAYVAAPDLSGNWSGTIAIPQKGVREKSPLHASFRQTGEELTGSLGPDAKAQLSIVRGRVETTKFGTVMTFDMPGQGFVMHFELRPFKDTLRGVAKLDGEKATAPVELQLVK